jgi:hypothetical protein
MWIFFVQSIEVLPTSSVDLHYAGIEGSTNTIAGKESY